MLKKYINLLFLALIVVVFVISYFKVPFLFFQQDEIFGFGQFIKEGEKIILSGLGAKSIQHFVPLTMSISYFIYTKFGLNYLVYNYVGLFFHLINGLLIYFLAKRIFSSRYSALIAALIFLSSSVGSELVMWPVINLNVISLTFTLLALVVVFKDQTIKGNLYFKSLLLGILFLLAVFSVEYSASLIIFIPLVFFLRTTGKLKSKIKYLLPYLIIVFSYLLLRFVPLILSDRTSALAVSNNGVWLPLRIIDLITKYLGQMFLGQDILIAVSRSVAGLLTEDAVEVLAEKQIFPILTSFIGLLFIVATYFLYKKMRKFNLNYSKIYLLIFIFIVLSSLPFLMVPGEANRFTVFSSRYLYFGLAGFALYLASVADFLIVKKNKRQYLYYVLIMGVFITYGMIQNLNKSQQLYDIGQVRQRILKKIMTLYPNLSPRTIFYTISDRSYYGLPPEEKIMPFQSGFGQTLLIFYSRNHYLPNEFYPGKFLWDIKSQGYKEIDGYGFGYYRDLDLLKKEIKQYGIKKDSVFSFRWISDKNVLVDISAEVRNSL